MRTVKRKRRAVPASRALAVMFAEVLSHTPALAGAIALTLRQAGDAGPFRLVITATFEPEDETTDQRVLGQP